MPQEFSPPKNFSQLLPSKLISDEGKEISALTKEERRRLLEILRGLPHLLFRDCISPVKWSMWTATPAVSIYRRLGQWAMPQEFSPPKNFNRLLPSKLISDEGKKISALTKEERRRLIEILRGLPLFVTGTRPIAEAIVTAGGVAVSQINPRTMESKIISGLYFAGEVVDVDGNTGGFNLQAAWAMGNAAGIFAAKKF